MKITHESIHRISKRDVFKNVNSYQELNDEIKKYGMSQGSPGSGPYNDSVGECFEIFTQFFCMEYGETPLIGIKNVIDTSDDPYNPGYDFKFTSICGELGLIQSKWRNNPTHKFTITDLATNGQMAYDLDIKKDNNILFTNLDDTSNLFDYRYETARNKRRVFGRNSQEELIKRDPNFWNNFRKCIQDSSKSSFENPHTLRDIQNWILYGATINNITYEGTESVLSGKYTKGKVEASTGSGKTLCQFYDIDRAFNKYNKNLAVMILPTRSLISQSFREFYHWKMFGDDNAQNNVSCLIIMSGSKPRYNDQIADVLQTLSIDESIKFINDRITSGREVVVFTTMKSHGLKYSDIIDGLKEKNIRVGLEIVDEYHNVISTSSERKEQEEIAEYLRNSELRTDGALFYSASHKDGQILSTLDENLFGKLLCRVTRNDLRIRGYVAPKLVFKIIRVKNKPNDSESRRNASRIGLDKDKAQSEAVAVISAYRDLSTYYENPNLITFGDHVEGCRYISQNPEVNTYLPGVKHHFMASETSNNDRDNIFSIIRESGGNILHQHSVAKEGINVNNLHGGIIGRNMSIISLQQAIGRPDRALYSDTLNLQMGKISLDITDGWKKYYNLIYVIVDSDESFYPRVKEIIGYLLDQGIPETEWDITELQDDHKGGSEYNRPDFFPTIDVDVKFDKKKLNDMIQQVKIEIIEGEKELQIELAENKERDELNSLSKLELLQQKL